MTTPLRSNPITGPSSLLRTSPPLCHASVLRPSRRRAAWVSPLASWRQVPVFLIEACLKVTPPPCRTPLGQSAGHLPILARGVEVRTPVSTSFRALRHVLSGSLSFVSLRYTRRSIPPPFPTTLTTR